MTRITVEGDFSKLASYLEHQHKRQMPFAFALVLTRATAKSRDDLKAHLAQRFTLRGTWLPRGIRATPADKRDWPKLQSVVGSKDGFMALQEEGGIRMAGNHRLGEPFAARPVKTAKVTRSKWPGAQLKRRRTFRNVLVQGHRKGSEAVLRRVGKDRYPLQVLFVLRKQVPIAPRLGMRRDVEQVLRRDMAKFIDEALTRAFAPKGQRRRG